MSGKVFSGRMPSVDQQTEAVTMDAQLSNVEIPQITGRLKKGVMGWGEEGGREGGGGGWLAAISTVIFSTWNTGCQH